VKAAQYRHPKRLEAGQEVPAVSIIVIVEDNIDLLVENLPQLMVQDHPQFEVVVVNDCGGDDITAALITLAAQYPNLKYTCIKPDIRFKHSRKIPLVVGIKAATYENLIFTDLDTAPRSPHWAWSMARGFVGREIVIGVSTVAQCKGLANQLIRGSSLSHTMRYLRAATRGKSYRGTLYNIGYTKHIFFKSNGYTHLRLALGEDDLFIQKVSTPTNTTVIFSPKATVEQNAWGGLLWWWRLQRFTSYSFRYYPTAIKRGQAAELTCRAVFHITWLALLSLGVVALFLPINYGFPITFLCTATGLWLLRELVVWMGGRLFSKRMGLRKVMMGYMVHDWFAPLSLALLTISRRIKPAEGLWK
ncbi:MAG: hypothetical protein RSC07_04750, partial [Mucinivorans sp.]